MTVPIAMKKWGNSRGIVIPKKILDQLDWTTSDSLELELINGELHIRKAFQHKSFEERLAAYQGKIEVHSFDWGDPAGREGL